MNLAVFPLLLPMMELRNGNEKRSKEQSDVARNRAMGGQRGY